MTRRYHPTQLLSEGTAEADVCALSAPVSFWGGFDPQTGIILEAQHPQRGLCLKGRFLLMERGKGSSGTPAGVAESLRNGSGPAGVILVEPDVNIATGALVAAQLYGKVCPVLLVSASDFIEIGTAKRLRYQEGLLDFLD